MITRFVKMHGCGNDFVVFDERHGRLDLSPGRAAAVADRRRGIGCDQLISIEPAPAPADAFMRIRNADGSEAEACGNATRCVAMVLAGEDRRSRHVIRTVAGDLTAETLEDGQVRVDMGQPRLGWQDIPLSHPADTLHLPLPGDPAAANLGNPHATWFVDLARAPLDSMGPALERDPLFPERANVGFAEVLSPERIRLRVFERGAGWTLACGSGACAALVNAHRRGLAARRAVVVLDGGELEIEWREDGHVTMAGPAVIAFEGTVDLATYPS